MRVKVSLVVSSLGLYMLSLTMFASGFVTMTNNHSTFRVTSSSCQGGGGGVPFLSLNLQQEPQNVKQHDEESDNENQRLLEKARLLRLEAQRLEEELRKENPSTTTAVATTNLIPKYTTLENSIWTLSFVASWNSLMEDSNKNEDSTDRGRRYSGKVTVRLLEDGYTEFLEENNSASSLPSSLSANQLKVIKVWGWDEEYSQEDDNQYLLFSMDVEFPNNMEEKKKRLYFQARIDTSRQDKTISLSDGTVTTKVDVAKKTKGMWGLFKVEGILSEFVNVGQFIAKPTAAPSSSSSS